MLLVGKENHEEITRIVNEQMERALRNLKPPDPEAVRDRNRKMKEYIQAMAAFDEGGKARIRNRSKSNGTESEP
jgi:predicted secreted Zn-dependent protease